MGAPARSAAGEAKPVMEAASGSEWARGTSRSRLGRPSASAGSRVLKPPKGHAVPGRSTGGGRHAGPPRYTNQNVRPRLMTAALDAASRRGYQALRISDITDPVNVTRQAFYAHFRDKRHCLCEALDPRLAVVERMASDDRPELRSEFSAEWTAQVIASIDELLGEHFGSAEGTKGRLIEALAAELQSTPSLAGVRIGNLVKRAHVPQGDFYRCFSGKRECFAALYEQRLEGVLGAVDAEAGSDPDVETILATLGAELATDPQRARLLVLGDGDLPVPDCPEMLGSRRGAFARSLARLLSADAASSDQISAGAVVEVIRAVVLAGELERLAERLVEASSLLLGDARPQLRAAA